MVSLSRSWSEDRRMSFWTPEWYRGRCSSWSGSRCWSWSVGRPDSWGV